MEFLEILYIAIYLAFVAGVAVVVRFYDVPVSEMKVRSIFKTFVGAIMAIGLGAWFIFDPNVVEDLINTNVFIELVALGLGGMAAFRALAEKIAPGRL